MYLYVKKEIVKIFHRELGEDTVYFLYRGRVVKGSRNENMETER